MYKILTLNNISAAGLDRLPHDKYEIASDIQQPDAIILNVGDWCYFKQVFDSRTITFLENNVQNLKENLTKSVVLRDIHEMVRDGKYDPSKFIQFSTNWVISCNNNYQLEHETNYFIIDKLLALNVHIIKNFLRYEDQLKERDNLFKFIDYNVFLTHPEIRNNVLNYMLQIINPTNDNIKALLDLMKTGEVQNETTYLRSQSSVITNDITRENDIIKFNIFNIHKVN